MKGQIDGPPSLASRQKGVSRFSRIQKVEAYYYQVSSILYVIILAFRPFQGLLFVASEREGLPRG
jgi:hypothetical protein